MCARPSCQACTALLNMGAPRNSAGTVCSALLLGLNLGVIASVFYLTDLLLFSKFDIVFLSLLAGSSLYFLAVTFIEWFSFPKWRPLRHMFTFLLSLGFLANYLVAFFEERQQPENLLLSAVHFIYYVACSASTRMQPYQVTHSRLQPILSSYSMAAPGTPHYLLHGSPIASAYHPQQTPSSYMAPRPLKS